MADLEDMDPGSAYLLGVQHGQDGTAPVQDGPSGHQEFEDIDAFMRHMLQAFPESTVGEDNDKQLIIYTNLFEDVASQAVVSFESIVSPFDDPTYSEPIG